MPCASQAIELPDAQARHAAMAAMTNNRQDPAPAEHAQHQWLGMNGGRRLPADIGKTLQLGAHRLLPALPGWRGFTGMTSRL
jgi:hypothetical protein